jgi:nucleoside-diphosphate-sugar epimerase
MRVFVTGVTGYLGHPIAARLLRGGHTLFGLVRTRAGADGFAALGGIPVPGHLAAPDEWFPTAQNCDAVVHVASAAAPDTAALDQLALETVRRAARDGRVRRLLYTSGVWVHGDTGGAVADESTPLAAAETVQWRPSHEDFALGVAADEVATVILRPGMVYGGPGGEFGGWFRAAREGGMILYPGDGRQHWSAVHRDDVAEAYALALEHAAGGEKFLIADESRFTVRELAEAAARAAGAQARALGRDETVRRFGAVGAALSMDQQITARKARRDLGWTPRHTSFVAEAESLHREWQAAESGAAR